VYETFTLCGHQFHGVLLSIVHRVSLALQPPGEAYRFAVIGSWLLVHSLKCVVFLKTMNNELLTARQYASSEFRLFRFRSPLLTESHVISFPHPTEMFQFGWYPACCYRSLSTTLATDYPLRSGLPHSETAGSMDYDSSPTNIAIICVLLRHECPRHPLSA
jgi:hypothetical protein